MRWGAMRRRPLGSCCAGARERRGAACTDLLPANSSTFPVKGCRSGRGSGSLRLPGGQRLAVGRQCAGGRCDVDRWVPAARARASGEEQLVPTSSRLILRLSRLKVAVPAANLIVVAERRERLSLAPRRAAAHPLSPANTRMRRRERPPPASRRVRVPFYATTLPAPASRAAHPAKCAGLCGAHTAFCFASKRDAVDSACFPPRQPKLSSTPRPRRANFSVPSRPTVSAGRAHSVLW